MSDYCRRRCCGHGYAAHDRRGYRDACSACGCHAFRPDLRAALVIAVVALGAFFAVIYLGITTGAHS